LIDRNIGGHLKVKPGALLRHMASLMTSRLTQVMANLATHLTTDLATNLATQLLGYWRQGLSCNKACTPCYWSQGSTQAFCHDYRCGTARSRAHGFTPGFAKIFAHFATSCAGKIADNTHGSSPVFL
jgi:hypothetical protein